MKNLPKNPDSWLQLIYKQHLAYLSHGMGPEYAVIGRVAPHLGAGDEKPVRRERAQPAAQVPLADQRPQPRVSE